MAKRAPCPARCRPLARQPSGEPFRQGSAGAGAAVWRGLRWTGRWPSGSTWGRGADAAANPPLDAARLDIMPSGSGDRPTAFAALCAPRRSRDVPRSQPVKAKRRWQCPAMTQVRGVGDEIVTRDSGPAQVAPRRTNRIRWRPTPSSSPSASTLEDTRSPPRNTPLRLRSSTTRTSSP